MMDQSRRFEVRPLAASDVDDALEIIADVRREWGLLSRVDTLLEPSDYALFDFYQRPLSAYFVALDDGRIAGGAGISALTGGDGNTCELQRMYLRAEQRGTGLGQSLLNACLDAARRLGYKRCYAETVSEMTAALAFYKRNGFRRLDAPVGETGHAHNDCWLMLDL
jgi:putative acetyltransferase